MKAVLAVIFLLAATPAGAATVSSELRLSFLGIPIASMKADTVVEDGEYSYSGTVRTTGLLRVVAPTKAQFFAQGILEDRTLAPTSHLTTYKRPRKSGELRLGFKGRRISEIGNVPPIKYKAGTVPLTKAHLASVIDPAAALILPVAPSEVGKGDAVCNRTIPIFDGKNRFNLVLRYKSTTQGKAEGFAGRVHTCSLRFQPVSGHRPFKKNIKFWTGNQDMSVSFAQIGDAAAYGLFAFNVMTDDGRAKGRAVRFQTN
jgi:hypothetical protein